MRAAFVAVLAAALCCDFALAADKQLEFKEGIVPVTWDRGFPVPPGATRNSSLGGATSVDPGKNYSVTVYDTNASVDAMDRFYAHYLPEARRAVEGPALGFSTARGSVTLVPQDRGTRITLVIGPQ
jgi:hypothetical protein